MSAKQPSAPITGHRSLTTSLILLSLALPMAAAAATKVSGPDWTIRLAPDGAIAAFDARFGSGKPQPVRAEDLPRKGLTRPSAAANAD